MPWHVAPADPSASRFWSGSRRVQPRRVRAQGEDLLLVSLLAIGYRAVGDLQGLVKNTPVRPVAVGGKAMEEILVQRFFLDCNHAVVGRRWVHQAIEDSPFRSLA